MRPYFTSGRQRHASSKHCPTSPSGQTPRQSSSMTQEVPAGSLPQLHAGVSEMLPTRRTARRGTCLRRRLAPSASSTRRRPAQPVEPPVEQPPAVSVDSTVASEMRTGSALTLPCGSRAKTRTSPSIASSSACARESEPAPHCVLGLSAPKTPKATSTLRSYTVSKLGTVRA